MSVLFNGNTDKVTHTAPTTFGNPVAGACLVWFFPTTQMTASRFIVSDVAAVNFHPRSPTPFLRFTRSRATTNLLIDSSTNYTQNVWNYVAVTYDSTGSDGDQRMVLGTLTTPATEVSYSLQVVGSGTVVDPSSGNWTMGNRSNNGRAFVGRLGFMAMYNEAKSMEELIAQQYNPQRLPVCTLFTHYGWYGATTQVDLSGEGNHGSGTSLTVADHMPLGSPYAQAGGWRGNFSEILAAANANRMLLMGVGI